MTINRFSVRKITQELEDVRTYTVGFGPSGFDFQPGQFSIVRLSEDVQGPLTLIPHQDDERAFEVTVKRTGNFGARFYDSVRAGDPLQFGIPMGKFVLENNASPICFLGRDYTIPAARAFLRTLQRRKDPRSMTLIHEITGVDQLMYDSEFREETSPQFTRVLVLDKPIRPNGWTGPVGRVTENMVGALYGESRETVFYAVGEGADMNYYRQIFEKAGIPRELLRLERWS
jgi:glycine betaine catabolism B